MERLLTAVDYGLIAVNNRLILPSAVLIPLDVHVMLTPINRTLIIFHRRGFLL